MSDTAVTTPTTTSDAPSPATTAETQAPGAVALDPAQDLKIVSKHEVRKQIHEKRMAERRAAEQAAAAPQPERNPDGTFKTKVDTTAAAADAGAPEKQPDAATAAPAEQATPDAAAAETRAPDASPEAGAAERSIRIPIPDGHALREMGRAEIGVATAEDEQIVRALLNGTYTRRQTVERLEARVAEETDKRIRLEAKIEAEKKWKGSPDYNAHVEKYHEIEDTIGKEAADRFWQGYQQELTKLEDAELETRQQQIEAEELDFYAEQWRNEAIERTLQIPADIRGLQHDHRNNLPGFAEMFDTAVGEFNELLDKGKFPQVQNAEQMHDEFEKFFAEAYLRPDPRVQRIVASKRTARTEAPAPPAAAAQPVKTEAEIRAEVEAELRQAGARRAAAPPHPMGNLAAASRAARVGDPEAALPSQPDPNASIHQIRRTARAAARERARTRMNGA